MHMGTRLSIWGLLLVPLVGKYALVHPNNDYPTQGQLFPSLVLIVPRHVWAMCPSWVLQNFSNSKTKTSHLNLFCVSIKKYMYRIF
ncbi:hypothetical protein HanPI659440_Chr05g0189391 [Helianthus annuus]|nr:hypothetical protein HanPI659440_Chr05g0189391 [Helianthus annuus]